MLNATVRDLQDLADYLIDLAADIRTASVYAPTAHPREDDLRRWMQHASSWLLETIDPVPPPRVVEAAEIKDELYPSFVHMLTEEVCQ